MASNRPNRIHLQVKRYGFDNSSSSDENVEEEEINDSDADGGEEIISDNDSTSSSEASIVSSNASAVLNDWHIVTAQNDTAPQRNFTAIEGWTNNIDTSDYLLSDYLEMFLPDSLFQLLCQWTNSRITIENATRNIDGRDELNCKPIDVAEMKTFLGLTILMGILKKPTIHAYWSCDSMISTPYFAKCMSRDRYLTILRYLRFSNPYNVDVIAKHTRLQDFMDKFHDIVSIYIPSQDLSLDESLLLFKGRLHFKQFIRIKRSRFGIKMFLLCDIRGYVIRAAVYYGARGAIEAGEPGCDALPKSEAVVVHLLSKGSLLDKGYSVSMDNYYCSTRLAAFLETRQTGMRGTIRDNRGVPQELKQTVQQPISSTNMRKDGTLLIKFSDKKNVYFISTIDKAGEVPKVRVLPGNQRIDYMKPTAIDVYNHHMGGVDITDQYMASADATRRSHTWDKKVGIHFLQRLIMNAYVLFRSEKQPNIQFGHFSKEAVAILTGIVSENPRGRRRARQHPQPQQHVLDKITGGNKQRPQKRCRICSRNGIRRDTRYECTNCPERPGLCMGVCFDLYHN